METLDSTRMTSCESQPKKKRRIPKACSACRRSKLRCDERRPCSRCIASRHDCVYVERPKDPTIERFERIEEAIGGLAEHLTSLSGEKNAGHTLPSTASWDNLPRSVPLQGHASAHGYTIPPSSGSDGGIYYHRPGISPTASHSTTSLGSATVLDSAISLARQTIHTGTDRSFTASYSPLALDGSPSSKTFKARRSTVAEFEMRSPSTLDVISSGQATVQDAQTWFATFFEGCDRFVPVFDPSYDTFESVRSRSSILFDVIVIYGCRAAHGVLSKSYQRLYNLIRQHTSDLVVRMASSVRSSKPIEDIQALLILTSYSDSGAVLCDVALCSAVEAGLPDTLDRLFALLVDRGGRVASSEISELYRLSRVWYCLFNLDQILSLDGGKPPSVTLKSSSRRVRALVGIPQRTALDLRLLAQVELNALRSASYRAIVSNVLSEAVLEDAIESTITGSVLDLDIWLSEWQSIVHSHASLSDEHAVMGLNLRIQHAWAMVTLHLRALSACGIENIALMTDFQRSIALAAKAAAERHLQLLLTDATVSGSDTKGQPVSKRPYVANFRYAMRFVWAKNAFCVLIVLRLGILLGDPPAQLIARLQEAHEFLHELERVGVGANISYTRILGQTVDKCERAVKATLRLQGESGRTSSATSDSGDFQTFIPNEFQFEWDFPGLNLCYIPLDWQDLFLDLGATP